MSRRFECGDVTGNRGRDGARFSEYGTVRDFTRIEVEDNFAVEVLTGFEEIAE